MTVYKQSVAQRIDAIQTEQELTLLCAQCIAIATASKARQRELIEQGHVKRFFRNVSGQNRRLSQTVTMDLATAQQLAQEMLQQLAARQLFTLQTTSVLQQRIHTLQLENDGKFNELAALLHKVYEKNRAKWKALEHNVSNLETNVRVIRWVLMHDATHYKHLTPAAFVLTIARDFYELTNGCWQDDDLYGLKKLLADYQMPKQLKLSHVLQENLLVTQLFASVRSLPEKDELYLPELVQIVRGQQQHAEVTVEMDALLFALLEGLTLIQELTKPTVVRYELELAQVAREERIHVVRVLNLAGFSSEKSRQLVRAEQAVVVKSFANLEEALTLQKALQAQKCQVTIYEVAHLI